MTGNNITLKDPTIPEDDSVLKHRELTNYEINRKEMLKLAGDNQIDKSGNINIPPDELSKTNKDNVINTKDYLNNKDEITNQHTTKDDILNSSMLFDRKITTEKLNTGYLNSFPIKDNSILGSKLIEDIIKDYKDYLNRTKLADDEKAYIEFLIAKVPTMDKSIIEQLGETPAETLFMVTAKSVLQTLDVKTLQKMIGNKLTSVPDNILKTIIDSFKDDSKIYNFLKKISNEAFSNTNLNINKTSQEGFQDQKLNLNETSANNLKQSEIISETKIFEGVSVDKNPKTGVINSEANNKQLIEQNVYLKDRKTGNEIINDIVITQAFFSKSLNESFSLTQAITADNIPPTQGQDFVQNLLNTVTDTLTAMINPILNIANMVTNKPNKDEIFKKKGETEINPRYGDALLGAKILIDIGYDLANYLAKQMTPSINGDFPNPIDPFSRTLDTFVAKYKRYDAFRARKVGEVFTQIGADDTIDLTAILRGQPIIAVPTLYIESSTIKKDDTNYYTTIEGDINSTEISDIASMDDFYQLKTIKNKFKTYTVNSKTFDTMSDIKDLFTKYKFYPERNYDFDISFGDGINNNWDFFDNLIFSGNKFSIDSYLGDNGFEKFLNICLISANPPKIELKEDDLFPYYGLEKLSTYISGFKNNMSLDLKFLSNSSWDIYNYFYNWINYTYAIDKNTVKYSDDYKKNLKLTLYFDSSFLEVENEQDKNPNNISSKIYTIDYYFTGIFPTQLKRNEEAVSKDSDIKTGFLDVNFKFTKFSYIYSTAITNEETSTNSNVDIG